MPEYNNQQYITEFHPAIVNATPSLPAAASYSGLRRWDNVRKREFVSDGTYWLSDPIHVDFVLDTAKPITTSAVAGTTAASFRVAFGEVAMMSGASGIVVEDLTYFVFDTVACTATNYFDWNWGYGNATGGTTGSLAVPGTANSQGQGANTFKRYGLLTTAAPQIILDAAVCYMPLTIVTRGATPSAHSIYPMASATFRIIG